MTFASRAGEKLEHGIKNFGISITGLICADFGSSTGGFVDCLLHYEASKVYAVETGYGVLDWKLRNDNRVIVMEKTNAMYVDLPEKVDLITIDTGWTRLDKIVPNAFKNLKSDGSVIALLKPHYEAEPRMLRKGKLLEEFMPEVLNLVKQRLNKLGANILSETESPITGGKSGNIEYLLYIKK